MELVEVCDILESLLEYLRLEFLVSLDCPMETPLGPIIDSAMPALLKIHARNQTYAVLSAAFAAAACCAPMLEGRLSVPTSKFFVEAKRSGLA